MTKRSGTTGATAAVFFAGVFPVDFFAACAPASCAARLVKAAMPSNVMARRTGAPERPNVMRKNLRPLVGDPRRRRRRPKLFTLTTPDPTGALVLVQIPRLAALARDDRSG